MNAKEMASAFNVSARTARRHIARGTTPDTRRTTGADGKTYPGSSSSYRHSANVRHGVVARDLAMARAAIRRIHRAMRFNETDVAELKTITAEAWELLATWEDIVSRHGKASDQG